MRKIAENLRTDPALKAELDAFLKKATAEDAAATKQLQHMRADLEVGQRRHQADELVRDLYGSSYGHDELRTTIESVLADLPVEKLDDEALGRLKRRHASQYLVKKLVELKGAMSASNEALVQNKLEAAMAAIPTAEGKQH
jgi:hypothetical protein